MFSICIDFGYYKNTVMSIGTIAEALVTLSHKHDGRLPLPTISQGPLLPCLVTEARACEQLAQSHYARVKWLRVTPATSWS